MIASPTSMSNSDPSACPRCVAKPRPQRAPARRGVWTRRLGRNRQTRASGRRNAPPAMLHPVQQRGDPAKRVAGLRRITGGWQVAGPGSPGDGC
jgi:hypothetical protein